MIVQFSSHALVIIWKRYYFLTKEFVYIVTKKNEKKITRYLSDIKDNGVAENELENARDNGTLADYLKKQDVSLSDEDLELISGGQWRGQWWFCGCQM